MRGARSFLALLIVGLAVAGLVYWDSRRDPAADGEARDRVFAVEADKIEEVTLTSDKGERTTLRRAGEAWQIVAPVQAAADAAETSGLATNIANLEIQRVIEEEASDLAQFGLESPRMTVAFKAGGEERQLLLGSKTPPGSDMYARLGDSRRVFLVPSYLESTFNRSPFELRDKTALKVEADKVDTIEIVRPKGTIQLVKADGEWRIAQPMAAPADFNAVTTLLGRLTAAQMKSIEPPGELKQYGLDRPAVIVRAGSGSARATLLVGKAAADPASVYAKDEARPEVFTIDATLVEDFTRDAAEYRQKDLFEARVFNTTRVEATRAGVTTAWEKTRVKGADGKEEEKWRRVAPDSADVEGAKVDALISAASSARAEGFVADTAKTGLASPELTLVLKFDDGKREDRVVFARQGDAVYAQRAGTPGAATIDAASLDAILKALDDLK